MASILGSPEKPIDKENHHRVKDSFIFQRLNKAWELFYRRQWDRCEGWWTDKEARGNQQRDWGSPAGMRNVTQEEKQKIPTQRVEAFFPQNASSFFPGQHPRSYLYCSSTGLVCTQCVTFFLSHSDSTDNLLSVSVSQGWVSKYWIWLVQIII